MARGAGLLHGILVPIVALAIAAGIGAIAAAIVPDSVTVTEAGRLSLAGYDVAEFGIGIGIASILAMLIGGAWGGALGARWHDKLEARTVEPDVEVRHA
jgi:hypothetical protein